MFKAKKDSFIWVLDIGSTKVAAGVCRLVGQGQAEQLVCWGEVPSRGMRNGAIVDMKEASSAVMEAVSKVERSAETRVGRALISVNARGMKSFNNGGSLSLGQTPSPVTASHVRKCMDSARNISLTANVSAVHDMIRSCLLDGEAEVDNPEGMVGCRLDIGLHIMTVSKSQVTHFIMAANQAGMSVEQPILQPVAAMETVLLPDEREYGCLSVDMGATSTTGIVLSKGKIQHSFSIPVGGEHFTRDVAEDLRISQAEAERMKCETGDVREPSTQEDGEITVTVAGAGQPQKISRLKLAGILHPRGEEVLEIVRGEVKDAGVDMQSLRMAVFTGGGSLLTGWIDLAKDCLGTPCRLGFPRLPEGWPEALSSPRHATLAGLFHRALSARTKPGGRNSEASPLGSNSGVGGRMKKWLSDFAVGG